MDRGALVSRLSNRWIPRSYYYDWGFDQVVTLKAWLDGRLPLSYLGHDAHGTPKFWSAARPANGCHAFPRAA
jgi:hypothetical protein